MKTVLFILLFFCPLAAFSQTGVENDTTSAENFEPPRMSLTTRFDNNSFPPPDFRHWKGFLGPEKISEARFYALAGYDDISQQAKKYHLTTSFFLWLSPVIFFLSSGIAVVGAFTEDGMSLFGVAGMIGSTITFTIGLSRIGKRATTYSEARSTADEYNTRLSEEPG